MCVCSVKITTCICSEWMQFSCVNYTAVKLLGLWINLMGLVYVKQGQDFHANTVGLLWIIFSYLPLDEKEYNLGSILLERHTERKNNREREEREWKLGKGRLHPGKISCDLQLRGNATDCAMLLFCVILAVKMSVLISKWKLTFLPLTG